MNMEKLINCEKKSKGILEIIPSVAAIVAAIIACFTFKQNADILKTTLADNNLPLISIENDYDFHEAYENSVEKTDYRLFVEGETLNVENVISTDSSIKIYDYVFKLKNIGRGPAKNLTLYNINGKEQTEIPIYNSANIFGDYKSIKKTIILNNDEKIQFNVKLSCQLSKNTKDSFIGLLFYQDIYDNLYGALLCLEVLIDTNNIAFGSINYFNTDMYGYKKKIAEMITNLYREGRALNENSDEANKIAEMKAKELLKKIENTIKLKKNEIKEYDKFLKNKIMIE